MYGEKRRRNALAVCRSRSPVIQCCQIGNVLGQQTGKRSVEGCVLAKTTGDFAVIIALKCETDFVAQNADFVKLTQDILDLAVANKCKTLDEVKALPMGNGTVQDAVTDRSGITGEKMELDGVLFDYTTKPPATIEFE